MGQLKGLGLVVLALLLFATPLSSASAKEKSQAKTLRIGALICLTGWFSAWDQMEWKEAQVVRDILNESGGITVEHFLPQSLFPVLSVHVANLIPICEHCNNPKGNNSPLENATLQNIFLPYHLHALKGISILLVMQMEIMSFLLNPKNPQPISRNQFMNLIRYLEFLRDGTIVMGIEQSLILH